MIHVLLTPPDTSSDLNTMGVLQLGCMPDWAARTFLQMNDVDGWTVQVIDPALMELPDDHPNRTLGQTYLHVYLEAHPEFKP